MTNKNMQRHNALLYGVVIVILLLIVVVPILLLRLTTPTVRGERAMTFCVLFDGETQEIQSWQQADDSPCYVFLPAYARSIQVKAQNPYTVDIENLTVAETINTDAIQMNTPYSYTVHKKTKTVAQGKLVFMQSANIPSLFLQTQSGSMEYLHASKENGEPSSYTLVEATGKSTNGTVMKMSGRGNTSWSEEKKGYSLWFEQDVSMLGMEPAQKYVLTANSRSNYLSNTLAFWLEEKMGIQYANQNQLIDLYLNGQYVGNYLLCEPIYVGENGIPIDDLDQKNFEANPGMSQQDLNTYTAADGSGKGFLWKNEVDSSAGGYLIERDVPEYYAEDDSGFILSSGEHYVIKSPRYASRNQVEYIQNCVQEAYDAISAPDGCHPITGKHYSEYIDVNSFALKYVLEEFLNFADAGRSSAYYYKNTGGLLCAGPGWDFEGAFLGDSQTVTHLNSTFYSTDWYLLLCRHEDFLQVVQDCHNELLKTAVTQMIEQEMPRLERHIAASVAMDTIRWQREDFGESCRNIENWCLERLAFLDHYWNHRDEVVTVTFVSSWQNNHYLHLSTGDVLNADQAPVYEGSNNTFLGWVDSKTGEQYTFGAPVNEDVTLTALWQEQPRSAVSALLTNIKTMLPELLFGACFAAVGIFFIITTRKRRKN